MKTINRVIFLLALLFISIINAQEAQLTKKDSIAESFWMVTLGTNFVDDSGDEFRELFDFEEAWNTVPYPSRISIGHYFKNGLGLEAIGSYNRYNEGKIIDDVVNPQDTDYLGLDFRVSYDLNKILGETGFFDSYIGVGAGYTDANNQGRGTYNAIVGFRTWLSDHWGLDFNSTGKWTMNSENSTNHVQHAVGVAYRFNVKKGISRRGEEKLAFLEEFEDKQQRIKDSIDAKQKEDEKARLLAEQLEREKVANQLAAEEKAKKDAEDAERARIKSEIDELGNVYFKLNSSYLTSNDKKLLDKLVIILEDSPTLEVNITAHTDSRGTDKYNQWLSERRAKRTVDYIISKGIDGKRITYDAFGEAKLVNECNDNTPCSEEKHGHNRRSEITIVSF